MAALTSAVTQMAQVMTPQPTQPQTNTVMTCSGNVVGNSISTSSCISPVNLASLRCNYLQQIRELHSLLVSGAISESEFTEQKTPILDQLKKLNPNQI